MNFHEEGEQINCKFMLFSLVIQRASNRKTNVIYRFSDTRKIEMLQDENVIQNVFNTR